MVKMMENPIKMDDLGGKPTIFGFIQMGPKWDVKLTNATYKLREMDEFEGQGWKTWPYYLVPNMLHGTEICYLHLAQIYGTCR